MLRKTDVDPLLAVMFEAGGAAAEACGPLKKLVAMVRDDHVVGVLKRMRRSPGVQKLKKKLKGVHRNVLAGRINFFEAPAAILNSEEWALAVAQLRDSLPAVAKVVESLAGLAPRLQLELPALMPRLMPIIMSMVFMGQFKKCSMQQEQPAQEGAAAEQAEQQQNKKKVKKTYRAKFVKDITVPDGTVFAGGETFTKTWTVSNSGEDAWPAETALLHVGGDMELRPSVARVPVGTVAPKGEVQVSVDMTTPKQDGRFWSYWRLVDSNDPAARQFGLRLWADVTVKSPPKTEEKEKALLGTLEAALGEVEEENSTVPVAPAPEATKEAVGEEEGDAPESVLDTALDMLGTALATPAAFIRSDGSADVNWEMLEALDREESAASHRQPEAVKMPGMEKEEGAAESVIYPQVGGPADADGAELPEPVEEEPKTEYMAAVETLLSMGFGPQQFQSALKRHNGDVQAIVQELLNN